MQTDDARAAESLSHLVDAVDNDRFAMRYDEANDVLSIALAASDDAVTVPDESAGLYVDVEPVSGDIISITALGYRAQHRAEPGLSLRDEARELLRDFAAALAADRPRLEALVAAPA